MSTFVYMTRCDGCGHCVDICPSDIMHIDENIRRAVNIEPNFCWECYSCVKACPNHAIDVRGYADFAPMVTVLGLDVKRRKELSLGKLNLETELQKILYLQLQQSLGENLFQN
jgi:adenylylsulfate reductase subunit B